MGLACLGVPGTCLRSFLWGLFTGFPRERVPCGLGHNGYLSLVTCASLSSDGSVGSPRFQAVHRAGDICWL